MSRARTTSHQASYQRPIPGVTGVVMGAAILAAAFGVHSCMHSLFSTHAAAATSRPVTTHILPRRKDVTCHHVPDACTRMHGPRT